jgi:competence protein ComEA
MLKKFLCAMALVWATVSGAAVDVNKATAAELDGIKGIGPSMSGKILDQRKKSPFKDWPDLISRVSGIGDKKAAQFSAEGLTVNGAGLTAAKAAPEKKPAPATASAPASAPATALAPADKPAKK